MTYVRTPSLRRWTYYAGEWKITRVPNFGRSRDIPPGSIFHRSLVERLAHDDSYHPQNKVWPKKAGGFLRLDRINTDVVHEAEPRTRSATSNPLYILSSGLESPTKACFELYTNGNGNIDQNEEDDAHL